jgi:hypothetical protein
MGNKVLERCTSCSNHNKKFGLCRPDGGTRFTGDIEPKWMFCGDMKNQGKLIAKGEMNG